MSFSKKIRHGVILSQMNNENYEGCVFVVDPYHMKFIDCNRAATESLGYTREELLQKGMHDIDATFSLEMIAAAYKSVQSSKEKQATVPSKFRRKDGTTFDVQIYLRAFEDQGKPYIIASVNQVSVVETAKAELQFHSVLFNHITDAVVSLNKDLCITSWNKYAAAIFGWEEHEVLGFPYRRFLNPSYLGVCEDSEREVYYDKGEWRGNVIFSRKNGERFPANVSYGLLKDADGNINGTVAVVRDRTEQQKKEKQLSYLAELVNKTYDAIISVDMSSIIISWNKGAEITYGHTAAEAIGKDIAVLLSWNNAVSRFSVMNLTPGKDTYWTGEETHYQKTERKFLHWCLYQ